MSTLRWPARVGLGLALVAFAATCVLLGRWQWHRYEIRSAANRVIAANYDAAAVPLSSVLAPDDAPQATLAWHPVEVTGTYEPDATLLVRGRVEDATTAYLVMVPLVTHDGNVFWVERGWVAMPDDAASVPHIALPSPGLVTVTAHLRESERRDGRAAPAGQVYSVTPQQLSEVAGLEDQVGHTYAAYYGELMNESPSAAQLGGFERPELDNGPHLSYALQWWFFALAGPTALLLVLRRQAARSLEPAAGVPAETGAAPREASRADTPHPETQHPEPSPAEVPHAESQHPGTQRRGTQRRGLARRRARVDIDALAEDAEVAAIDSSREVRPPD